MSMGNLKSSKEYVTLMATANASSAFDFRLVYFNVTSELWKYQYYKQHSQYVWFSKVLLYFTVPISRTQVLVQ